MFEIIQPIRIVTTSWDDGHPLDIRLADMLSKFGIAATFYIPIENSECSRMSDSQIRQLANTGCEIGGHTYSHCYLTTLSLNQAHSEILKGKIELENIIGSKTSMFAYPGGYFNTDIMDLVCKAGYRGARTTEAFHCTLKPNPFRMGTTIQAYPHQRLIHIRHALKDYNFRGLLSYISKLHLEKDWLQIAIRTFGIMLRHGGVWHLWGHSWEIEKMNLWMELEELFYIISGNENIEYLTNNQLLERVLKQ